MQMGSHPPGGSGHFTYYICTLKVDYSRFIWRGLRGKRVAMCKYIWLCLAVYSHV
jgi:hypothetical protein